MLASAPESLTRTLAMPCLAVGMRLLTLGDIIRNNNKVDESRDPTTDEFKRLLVSHGRVLPQDI